MGGQLYTRLKKLLCENFNDNLPYAFFINCLFVIFTHLESVTADNLLKFRLYWKWNSSKHSFLLFPKNSIYHNIFYCHSSIKTKRQCTTELLKTIPRLTILCN